MKAHGAIRSRRHPLLVGLLGLVMTALFVVGGESFAQGPAPSGAAPSGHSAADAGGSGESTYGCVESVPKGAQRPVVVDTFPSRGTSGWAVALSVTIRHGKGERVLPSGLDLSSAVEAKKVLKQSGFSIPDQDGGAGAQIWTEADDPQKAEATTHLELPVVLLPPNPGRNGMVLPPLPVAVARANGEIATVCTHAHAILVEDPTANTPDAMPKENPPGMPQREEWTALKRALGWGALGLAIGAVLAILLWRKLNEPKPEPPPPPPRPPWEVALEALDEVRHAGLLEVGRYSEHFDRTSDAIRRYLGARFGFDGLESTTDEILTALQKQAGGFIRFDGPATRPDGALRPAFGPTPGISFERVASFLRECDLVKFANLTPTPEQCSTSITAGEAIVRSTMPTSTGRPAFEEPAPSVDPVAAAQLRAPFAPPAAPPPRVRSPYEPPEPDEGSPATTAPRDAAPTVATSAEAPATRPEGAPASDHRDPEGGPS